MTTHPRGTDRSADTSRAWSRPAWWLASTLVALRWVVVLAWVAVAGFALTLPPPSSVVGGLSDITSVDNPALRAEQASAEQFGFPLLSRLMTVQSDPAGLSDEVLTETARRAAQVTQQGDGPILAALPVPADERIAGVREPGTAVVTYLFQDPQLSFADSLDAARAYGAELGPDAGVVGVTGSVPARVEQERLINAKLPLLEAVSLIGVTLIVAIAFRSIVAPLLTLGVAGLSFLLMTRLSGLLATQYDLRIPAELEPLMVALMLGVTTDYVVYMLSGLRAELAGSHDRTTAARRAVATFLPIVFVAGLTISAGVATLMLAESSVIRAFGPALVLAVAVSLVVCVTLLPALTGILGRKALWPAKPPSDPRGAQGGPVRRGVVRMARNRFGAITLVLGCLVVLTPFAANVLNLRTGLPFIAALPADNEVARAAGAAEAAFVPGITSPTLVDVRGGGSGDGSSGGSGGGSGSEQAYQRLQDVLAEQPHVAAVIGPREEDVVSRAAERELRAFTTADGGAARYLVVLDVDPLDSVAIEAVDDLRRGMPDLLQQAGLDPGAEVCIGGDTAAVGSVISQTNGDLLRIVGAALLVNLLLLIVFLRALVAPLFMLFCTALSAAATLGFTVFVFQQYLGHAGITFFVPLATVVLLIALGSDYNLFAIGHVWNEARRHDLRDAMLAALPRSSGAITTAGLALAASLAALALIPLRQSHELAFTLVVGILLDALVIRTLLVPAFLGLFGRFSGWPGRRLARRPGTEPEPVTAHRGP